MKTGFYTIQNLDKKTLIKFYKDAVDLAYNVHIDILDANTSWIRQRTEDKTIKEMIDNCDPKYHNVCIDRSIQYGNIDNCGEIGYCTSSNSSYFLYIFTTVANLKILTKKYKLEMK
jgi:hypothetical protein